MLSRRDSLWGGHDLTTRSWPLPTRKENVPVTRYWCECEHVNLMLITVVRDAP